MSIVGRVGKTSGGEPHEQTRDCHQDRGRHGQGRAVPARCYKPRHHPPGRHPLHGCLRAAAGARPDGRAACRPWLCGARAGPVLPLRRLWAVRCKDGVQARGKCPAVAHDDRRHEPGDDGGRYGAFPRRAFGSRCRRAGGRGRLLHGRISGAFGGRRPSAAYRRRCEFSRRQSGERQAGQSAPGGGLDQGPRLCRGRRCRWLLSARTGGTLRRGIPHGRGRFRAGELCGHGPWLVRAGQQRL